MDRVKDKAQEFKEKTQDTAQSLKEKAQDTMQSAQEKAEELKGEIQESWKTPMGRSWDNKELMEGPLARTIERQTAKLPSDLFLWAAVGSICTSLVFQMMDRKEDALFVGQWAPTFLILGLYNKLVKLQGHDAVTGSSLSS